MQSCGDIRAKTSVGQPDIQDSQIRLTAVTEFNSLLYGTGNATDFVPACNLHLFEHVGHGEVVFGNHDCGHLASPFWTE